MSVFKFAGGRILFGSLKPRSGKTLAAQWQDIHEQLDELLAGHDCQRGHVVRECVFVRSSRVQRDSRRHLLAYYDGALPVTSFIKSPPVDGEQVVVEVMVIKGKQFRVRKISENLAIVSEKDCRWAYVGGIEPNQAIKDTYSQAVDCFFQLKQQLESVGFKFDQVVRTWIYERDIVAQEKDCCGACKQRYQVLNDARYQFFTVGKDGQPFAFAQSLPPASTGIGMSEGSFVMECLALESTADSVKIRPLNNPEQIDAHSYSASVLEKGELTQRAAPMFSRGMSILKDYGMLIISGTASIKGQLTVCLDDAAGQTRTTLENIDLVLQQAQASLKDVQQLRVYVTHSPDPKVLAKRIETIRNIVLTTVPNVPTQFLLANVCRENLLVEIEALSFVQTV